MVCQILNSMFHQSSFECNGELVMKVVEPRWIRLCAYSAGAYWKREQLELRALKLLKIQNKLSKLSKLNFWRFLRRWSCLKVVQEDPLHQQAARREEIDPSLRAVGQASDWNWSFPYFSIFSALFEKINTLSESCRNFVSMESSTSLFEKKKKERKNLSLQKERTGLRVVRCALLRPPKASGSLPWPPALPTRNCLWRTRVFEFFSKWKSKKSWAFR